MSCLGHDMLQDTLVIVISRSMIQSEPLLLSLHGLLFLRWLSDCRSSQEEDSSHDDPEENHSPKSSTSIGGVKGFLLRRRSKKLYRECQEMKEQEYMSYQSYGSPCQYRRPGMIEAVKQFN